MNKLSNSVTFTEKHMKLLCPALGFLTIALFSSYSVASVYKCTDDQGKTAYQSSPCAAEKKALKIDIETGQSIDLAVKLKQQKQDIELKKLQEIEKKHNIAKELKRQKDAAEQSAINQQLIRDNPVQYTAFAIPPYHHDKLPSLVKHFEARLPEIERFRRLAAQKALATGECQRVESDQLSIQSRSEQLVISIDCSTAKNFQFSEKELSQ